MKNLKHLCGILLVWFVILGSLFLVYMQTIDGVYIRKPFIFQKGIDPQNLKTDKALYHRGDMISILTSVCKYRDYKSETTWKIINATVITFPSMGSKLNSTGCTLDKWIPIGKVPEYAVNGKHHMEATTAVILNNIHTIYYQFRTVDFDVK